MTVYRAFGWECISSLCAVVQYYLSYIGDDHIHKTQQTYIQTYIAEGGFKKLYERHTTVFILEISQLWDK